MRRLGLVCAWAALFLPAVAQAQYDKNNDRYEPLIVTDDSRGRPPGTYVVVRGDTLWGLSEQVFGDGHYWPTLWSYNPQITNPHWIYPGDLVYLKPRLKTRTEKTVVFAKSRFSEAPRLVEVLARYKGFVTQRQYKESGRIAASREEKEMLGEFDEVYLEFSIPKRILPGEEYTIYRPLKQITNPADGKPMGQLIQHIGVVRVLSVDSRKGKQKQYLKALILESYEEVGRGDRLTKRVWSRETVLPVENKISLWSRVLAHFRDVSMLGEYDYVVVDKGFKHKLRRGNRLILRLRGDGLRDIETANDKRYPWENFGEVMIIEPFESTSLGIVIRSIKEVGDGDVLEMLRGY